MTTVQNTSESEFGLFAMYVIQTQNLLWQGGAKNKHTNLKLSKSTKV